MFLFTWLKCNDKNWCFFHYYNFLKMFLVLEDVVSKRRPDEVRQSLVWRRRLGKGWNGRTADEAEAGEDVQLSKAFQARCSNEKKHNDSQLSGRLKFFMLQLSNKYVSFSITFKSKCYLNFNVKKVILLNSNHYFNAILMLLKTAHKRLT